MLGLRTLVLQRNYMPISLFPLHTISAEDAITRVINETCHVVLEYDREILTTNPDFHMKWPSVIARNTGDIISNRVKLTKEYIYYRDHGICAYCEGEIGLNRMTLDHVVPRRHGGIHSWDNLVASCDFCNFKKGHKMPVGEWKPKRIPFEPTYWQLLKHRKKFPIRIFDKNWTNFLGDWTGKITVVGGVAEW